MNEYCMEIIGKILLFGGFLGAVISQTHITNLAFKIRFSAGLYCLLITPIYALVSDLRKDNNVRIFLKLWGASLGMVVLGAFVLAAL
jgi:hypothetical protein